MRRQDHTHLPYALAPVVRALCSLTDRSPPCRHDTRPTLPRPPQPAPTFVTMANAPLPGRDGGDVGVIWGECQAEFRKNRSFVGAGLVMKSSGTRVATPITICDFIPVNHCLALVAFSANSFFFIVSCHAFISAETSLYTP